ncbi:MAG TPA: CopD family protein [Gaiellaceae bacterium]
MRRALLAAVLLALAAPAAASAHASIRSEWPAYRERMAFSPRQIIIRFDQTVEVLPNAIQVLDANGRNLAGRAHTVARGMAAPVPKLPRGAYTVRWKALSTDGHVVNGVYTFGVRVRAPVVTDAVGAQGPTTVEHVVRWLYFLGLALLVGGLGFELLVARVAHARRFWLLVGGGAVGLLEVGIVAFLLRAEDALQLPFTAFLYGDLSPIAGGTRFGEAFIALELGFAVVAALVFLAWLTERRAFLWSAFALGLALGSGLSLSGHSAATRAETLADWFHLSAATLWIGGLVQLALVARTASAFRRFSRLATCCVAVLILAGTYLSIERFPRTSDLWTTHYGHVLLIKLALVSVALLWGAAHQFLVLPRLERIDGRVGRSLLAESAVAMAVLLVAAVLVDSKPPATPLPVTSTHARSDAR